MPNGHDYSKEYGPHDYGDRGGTSDCKHGCGCWAGPTRSGGPTGLDPFGECPNNPKDGVRLEGKGADYHVVVERRIREFESDLREAKQRIEAFEEITEKGSEQLVQERNEARSEVVRLRIILGELHAEVQKTITESEEAIPPKDE